MTVAIGLVAVALIALALIVTRSHADSCQGGGVFYQPAGTCMNPQALEVYGDPAAVELAVALYGGVVLYRNVDSSHVRFAGVNSLDDLDRIKQGLTAAGFFVRYSVVGQLF